MIIPGKLDLCFLLYFRCWLRCEIEILCAVEKWWFLRHRSIGGELTGVSTAQCGCVGSTPITPKKQDIINKTFWILNTMNETFYYHEKWDSYYTIYICKYFLYYKYWIVHEISWTYRYTPVSVPAIWIFYGTIFFHFINSEQLKSLMSSHMQ